MVFRVDGTRQIKPFTHRARYEDMVGSGKFRGEIPVLSRRLAIFSNRPNTSGEHTERGDDCGCLKNLISTSTLSDQV